jgi:predicted Zn-dependent protease with MMP-like domain
MENKTTADYKNTECEAVLKKDLINIFESVKEAVRKTEGRSRAGLMLGLQEMGSSMQGFVGAYYPVDSNIIVLNKTILRRISETNPELFKPYSFHVLLHEYIHSLGMIDERMTRQKTYEICKKQFGEDNLITELSKDITKFYTNLIYPGYGWKPEIETGIELVKGFDRSNTMSYIS